MTLGLDTVPLPPYTRVDCLTNHTWKGYTMSKKRKDPNGSISKEALEFVRSQQSPVSGENGGEVSADWSTVEANLLLGAIYAYCSIGGAILFGTSRDGFLFSVSVYAGGEKATKWFHCVKEFDALHDYLRMVIETFDGT